jgi:hypothetical protein
MRLQQLRARLVRQHRRAPALVLLARRAQAHLNSSSMGAPGVRRCISGAYQSWLV